MAAGLIPARAGNTHDNLAGGHIYGAHPRSRGEHLSPRSSPCWSRGSSPLARGTQAAVVVGAACPGLIPARAGNTPAHGRAPRGDRAHPRSRGEHCFKPLWGAWRRGSSPLARGTPLVVSDDCGGCGLIPARAGNTEHVPKITDAARAHPRSRGEHGGYYRAPGRVPGSSPLARGTPALHGMSLRQIGLIPARAGNTGLLFLMPLSWRAHPRSRGEHKFS